MGGRLPSGRKPAPEIARLGAAPCALLAYASLFFVPRLLGRRPFLRLPQTRNQIHRAPAAIANPPSGRWNPGRDETAPAFSLPLLATRTPSSHDECPHPRRVLASCSGVYCASLIKISAPLASSRKLSSSLGSPGSLSVA